MGRNLAADILQYPEVTHHKQPATRMVLMALAYHALDMSYEGSRPQRVLMQTAQLKSWAFHQAMHDIECSGEVIFYDDPGKPCHYFLWWMHEFHEVREGRSPAPLSWPEQFKRLGHKCPRPERLIWTPEATGIIRQLHVINDKRRTARKARQG